MRPLSQKTHSASSKFITIQRGQKGQVYKEEKQKKKEKNKQKKQTKTTNSDNFSIETSLAAAWQLADCVPACVLQHYYPSL